MHDFNMGGILQPGVNILHYSQIKYLGKVSIFWYFGEEFPHFYQCFKTLFQILMKNANNFVESMIYALLLGKSFSLTFGKCFLGFRKIFTPDSKKSKISDRGGGVKPIWDFVPNFLVFFVMTPPLT